MSVYLIDYENTTTSGLKGIEKLADQDRVIIFYGKSAAALPFNIHIQIAKSKASLDYIKAEKVGKNYLDFQLGTYCGYLIGTTKETNYIIVSKDAGYDSLIDFWKKEKCHLRLTRTASIEEALTGSPKPALVNEGIVKEPIKPVLKNNSQPAAVKESSKEAAKDTIKENNRSIPVPVKTEGALPPGQTVSKPVVPIVTRKLPAATPAPGSSQTHAPVLRLSEAYKKKIRTKIKVENLKGGSYNRIYNLFLRADSKQAFNIGLVKAFKQEKGNRIYKLLLNEFENYLVEK